MHTADTAFHFQANGPGNPLGLVKSQWGKLDSSLKKNPAGTTVGNPLNKVNRDLDERLKNFKKKSFSYNLTVESDGRFQPVPNSLSLNTNQKFVNIFAVTGNVQAWGIPLNLSLSSDRSPFGNPLSPFNSNLFKFDFDPKKYSSLFQSDLQQYYDLKKTVMGGMDLTSYTTRAALTELKAQQAHGGQLTGDSTLSKYLSDPSHMNALLKMDDGQIKQKLMSVVASEDPALKTTGTADQIADGSKVKTIALNGLGPVAWSGHDADLKQYLSNPANLNQFRGVNEKQIAERLTKITTISNGGKKGSPDSVFIWIPVLNANISRYVNTKITEAQVARAAGLASFDHFHVPVPVLDVDISGYIKKKMIAAYATNRQKHDQEINKIVRQLANTGTTGKAPDLKSLFAATGASAPGEQATNSTGGSGLTPESQARKENQENRADSIAAAISNIRTQLQKQGLDAGKMLDMQQYLNGSSGKTVLSEQESNFMTRKPANRVQSLFTNVQSLKFGAFGDNVPGNTAHQDLFMTGTSITFKSGNIPIAFGYGSINDISAAKDAGYQSSVYNTSRSFTFLGTTLKSAGPGDVKIAVIGSVNNQSGNSLYTQPATSSNDVALTFTKDISLEKIGEMSVSVSKSNTLFDNKYQPGNEAVLEQKGGLQNSAGTDLLEAMSFGFTHHLDLTWLQASDNFYFNYSGTGYQNPGNNGYGGAKMKIGGNIRKAFYKNKLIVNVRTDIGNMPISYTTSDKWKSYQLQLDSRYTINKKTNISFKYTTNGTSKKVDDIVTPVYSFQKIQADGNMSYKIGKNYTVSHLSIGMQQFSNTGVSLSAGKLLMVNYTQSIILNTNTLTGSFFYNKELSALQLIGNMLTSDLGYTYKLFDRLNMSSAVTYLSNSGIARQAGIRQGIQLFATKQFDLDSYVDLRKNMIVPLYPDLYSACRAELSLKYHLKN
ncbi:MAG: hypothetical protein ACXVAY_12970 [Mucilaginibacter sp.]